MLCRVSLTNFTSSLIVLYRLQASLGGSDDGGRNFNKLEKADILELAVEHLRLLQKHHDNALGT